MSTTYNLRRLLLDIARRDVGKVEVSRNQAPWIKKYWPATTYPEGHDERQPYCAASLCHDIRQWLKYKTVRDVLGLESEAAAEKWRCKSPSCFKASYSWESWAKAKGLLLGKPKSVNYHAGDIIIYKHSHIEIYVNDVDGEGGDFWAIGANTDSGGSRDGDGKWEKTRTRADVRSVIRMLE